MVKHRKGKNAICTFILYVKKFVWKKNIRKKKERKERNNNEYDSNKCGIILFYNFTKNMATVSTHAQSKIAHIPLQNKIMAFTAKEKIN